MFDGAADTNVLLDFAHANAIDLLVESFGQRLHVVSHVHTVELAKGVAVGKVDPCDWQGAIWPTIIHLDTTEQQLADKLTLRLGERNRGEAESLSACYHRDLILLSNDGAALKAAQKHGVPAFSTIGVLNRIVRSRIRARVDVLKIAQTMTIRGIDPTQLL